MRQNRPVNHVGALGCQPATRVQSQFTDSPPAVHCFDDHRRFIVTVLDATLAVVETNRSTN
jgi:hypothetical protein